MMPNETASILAEHRPQMGLLTKRGALVCLCRQTFDDTQAWAEHVAAELSRVTV
jgi:hypothetical protein